VGRRLLQVTWSVLLVKTGVVTYREINVKQVSLAL
jgi:hypothetical protein